MKILYVEDNAVNLSLIQRIAQMNKHSLTNYDEAEKALDALDSGETDPDLILLDIQLAGEMDGIDFAKAARKKGYKQPIIAITAYAMLGDKERIIEAGCNEYLPKPLPIAEFLTLMAKYDPASNPEATTATPKTEDNGKAEATTPPKTEDNGNTGAETTAKVDTAAPTNTQQPAKDSEAKEPPAQATETVNSSSEPAASTEPTPPSSSTPATTPEAATSTPATDVSTSQTNGDKTV